MIYRKADKDDFADKRIKYNFSIKPVVIKRGKRYMGWADPTKANDNQWHVHLMEITLPSDGLVSVPTSSF